MVKFSFIFILLLIAFTFFFLNTTLSNLARRLKSYTAFLVFRATFRVENFFVVSQHFGWDEISQTSLFLSELSHPIHFNLEEEKPC